jgi:hypothetical protein
MTGGLLQAGLREIQYSFWPQTKSSSIQYSRTNISDSPKEIVLQDAITAVEAAKSFLKRICSDEV